MKEFKIHEKDKLKAGFSTPENYFESFTDRLMAQLAEAKPEPKVVPLYRRMPIWLSAAAVFIVLMTAGWFFLLNNPKATAPDDAAIENYLVYNTNASVYDITQELSQQDIDNLESNLAVSDDAIEDYLYDNLYE